MMNRVPLLWIFLIFSTIASYALADSSVLPWISAIVLALTVLKGYLIVDGFMELYGHRHIIRYAMNLYCPVVCLLIWVILRH